MSDEKNYFKPRARIINIIGKELISNDVIALVELVKNSYDADSKKVWITLNNIDKKDGTIIIEDNGTGMTFNKVKNVWLEPATPDKKKNSNEAYTECYGRRFLGEKGVGRFAVHRLGKNIKLTTRAKKNCSAELEDEEITVYIDWSKFSENKYLSQIPVQLEKTKKPQIFKGNSGTKIIISGIQPWINKENVEELIKELRSLETPNIVKEMELNLNKPLQGKVFKPSKKDPGFSITISSNVPWVNEKINQIKTIDEVLKTAFYTMKGHVDKNGIITYSYSFHRPDYHDLKRDEENKTSDLKLADTAYWENNILTTQTSNGNQATTPGNFNFLLFAWDLDSIAKKVAGLAQHYTKLIKPNSGVRLYRNHFRVWPYGEKDDDWLGLDLKRLNFPATRTVSRNQVIGFISITAEENPELRDQSNREGLIENIQYRNFHTLVKATFNIFAKERLTDKEKLDNADKKKSIEDKVTYKINKLKEKVHQNQHNNLYLKDIENLQTIYHNVVNDTLDRYMMAAAIGISYSIPVHEMILRLKNISDIIEDIKSNPNNTLGPLNDLTNIVNDTGNIVNAVSSIMSKQQTKKFLLNIVSKNVEILKKRELEKHNIKLNIIDHERAYVHAIPGLLNTAILNLLDNAIYWVRAMKMKMRETQEAYQGEITIETGINQQKNSYIKIIDNGTGLEDSLNILKEPYYSRKTEGLGLGLYLVSEIAIRAKAKLNAYNNESTGATFEVIFPEVNNEQ